MPALVVCFEGIDAAGKRTQADLLARALEKMGIKSSVYSYPDYAFDYGRLILRFLHGELKLSQDELFFLYIVDMAKDKERRAADLASGKVVILDRYFYSDIAYQCAAGFDYARAEEAVRVMDLKPPEIIFYIDIDPKAAAERKRREKGTLDAYESNTEFLDRVRVSYQKVIGDHSKEAKWIMIDGSSSIQDVHGKVMDALLKEAGLVSA